LGLIVDEAHTIKNRKAKMSQAACALSAKFRWCLTGTPYQNSVDDVYSLVKFLRIPPFAGWEYFRAKISGVAKNGNMSLALGRLRTLLCAIMLRRKKDILKVVVILYRLTSGKWSYASGEGGYFGGIGL
jgi:SNF2 family DNA or RNA helicase